MTLLLLLGAGTAVCSALLLVAWRVASRIDNYGIVDIAWTASIGLLAAGDVLIVRPPPARAALVLACALAWSARLSLYLTRRIAALHPTEDTRYQDLRASWGPGLRSRMFWFFQAQAVAGVFFSLPFGLAAFNRSTSLQPLEWAGAALWAVGFLGESAADRQLARFKADPVHRGAICDAGLWRYSRHPNYFFEWIVWCGFACLATPAPWGVLAWACPAVMLWLLLRVTGIPATEAAAVARRGDAYRRYQQTTSAFVPWFPAAYRANRGSR